MTDKKSYVVKLKTKKLEEALKELDLDKVDIIEEAPKKEWFHIPPFSEKLIETEGNRWEKERCENCGNDKFYFFLGKWHQAILICTKCKECIPLDLL